MPPSEIERDVLAALRTVDDPELGVNIVDLGLVHRVLVRDMSVEIVLMMTTPTCPLGRLIATTAETAVANNLPGPWAVRVVVDRDLHWAPERAAWSVRQAIVGATGIGGMLKTGFKRLFAEG